MRGLLWIVEVVVLIALSGASTEAGPIFVTGAGEGGGPHVRVFDAQTGQELLSFLAFDPGFTGGARVATADVNGDGVPDPPSFGGATGPPWGDSPSAPAPSGWPSTERTSG